LLALAGRSWLPVDAIPYVAAAWEGYHFASRRPSPRFYAAVAVVLLVAVFALCAGTGHSNLARVHVTAAELSPDGRTLAVARCSADPSRTALELRDLRDGRQRLIRPKILRAGLAWSPGGEFLAFGGTDAAGQRPAV